MFELYFLLVRILSLYQFIIFAAIILSWLRAFGVLPYSRPIAIIQDILYRLTEPVFRPVRSVIPSFGGLDLSPIIVFFGIEFIKILLRQILL